MLSSYYVAVGLKGTRVWTHDPISTYNWMGKEGDANTKGIGPKKFEGTQYESYYNYYFIIYGGNYTWVTGGESGILLRSS